MQIRQLNILCFLFTWAIPQVLIQCVAISTRANLCGILGIFNTKLLTDIVNRAVSIRDDWKQMENNYIIILSSICTFKRFIYLDMNSCHYEGKILLCSYSWIHLQCWCRSARSCVNFCYTHWYLIIKAHMSLLSLTTLLPHLCSELHCSVQSPSCSHTWSLRQCSHKPADNCEHPQNTHQCLEKINGFDFGHRNTPQQSSKYSWLLLSIITAASHSISLQSSWTWATGSSSFRCCVVSTIYSLKTWLL